MPDKPKIGFYWCASCGGCEETVVDLAEDILGVIEAVDIVLWPVRDGFQEEACRGDAGQVNRRHAAQRGDPHQRAGGDGAFAPAQEPVPDRLRSLRANGRHSQPGQSILARATSALRVRGSAHGGEPGEDAAADFVSEQRSHRHAAGISQCRPRARPGGGRGLSISPAARRRPK